MIGSGSLQTKGNSLAIRFRGLPKPVLLDGCAELFPLIRAAMPLWPCTAEAASPQEPPCITLCRAETGAAPSRYRVTCAADSPSDQDWNAVSAVCLLIADLAFELLRADDSLFCLHGAAVAFGGRLILFPDDHHAGKSTLTAVLGQRGHVVFSDDVLPVAVGADGRIEGIANGILPRIRLPVPDDLGQGFRDWASDNPGPANSQYKYLQVPRLAQQGARLPIGAIVRLERRAGAATMLQPLSQGEAFESVIGRNFARDRHSAHILTAFGALAGQARLHRLGYASAEAAADLLASTFGEWSADAPRLDQPVGQPTLTPDDAASIDYDPKRRYVRSVGLAEVVLDGQHYLADGEGRGLFRLNPGARAIWAVLEEPATGSEVGAILTEAFPDADPHSVAEDCMRTMEDLVRGRLVVTADPA